MFCRLPRGGRRIHGKMFTRVQTSWLRPLLEIQMLSLTQTTDTSSDLDKQTDVRVSVMISDSKTVTQYLIMQMINVTLVKFFLFFKTCYRNVECVLYTWIAIMVGGHPPLSEPAWQSTRSRPVVVLEDMEMCKHVQITWILSLILYVRIWQEISPKLEKYKWYIIIDITPLPPDWWRASPCIGLGGGWVPLAHTVGHRARDLLGQPSST